MKPKNVDKILVEISCTTEMCEELREQGLFFESIADALGVDRDDVREIEYDKS